MAGNIEVTGRFLVVILVCFLTGCQFLPKNEEQQRLLTSEELQATSQAIQNNLQQQLKASEKRQVAALTQQTEEIQRLKKLVKHLQEENLRFQQQHSSQLQQLARLLEPGFISTPVTEVVLDDGKMLLGRHEWVYLPAQKLVLPARIDSGANTSSLHAVNVQQFERDGKTWVKFETHYQSEKDQPASVVEVEAPMLRKVKVTQASGSEARPVVSLPVQLGPLTQTIEFTLTDRGNLTFPVLLGRRFFMDIALVDVSKTYVQGKPEIIPQPPAYEESAL